MRLACTPEHERLIRKLDSIWTLSGDDKRALLGLPLTVRDYDPDADIVNQGDRPRECALILEGVVCGYKLTTEGRRQIISFFVPGDLPDLQSLHLHVMDHSIGTITATTAAFIPHEALRELLRTHAGLIGAFWRDTLIDGAIFREWLVSLGRRSAYSRIAHLLCEFHVRLSVVGLAGEEGFTLPLTQAELADALGLSSVHVNRALQALRQDGLIVSRGRYLSIPDWQALANAGEFDRGYLHMSPDAAAG
jgi:CRP-like cAMP-binding protein